MKGYIQKLIREVPDWPVEGVNFKDISPVVSDPSAFRHITLKIEQFCKEQFVNTIVSPDARGWLFAAPLSQKLQIPMHLIRKPGKLPPPVASVDYDYEYASSTLEMPNTDLTGKIVCIIDDVSATGGTALATVDLIKQAGAKKIVYACFIDLAFLGGTEKLEQQGVAVYSYLKYE